MTNYPPGVTGSEWAIAGPAFENDEHRTCGVENVTLVTMPEGAAAAINKVVNEMLKPEVAENRAAWASRLQVAMADVEETEVAECPFEGEVTVWGDEFGVPHWTCPVCGNEHEEDPREPGDDD